MKKVVCFSALFLLFAQFGFSQNILEFSKETCEKEARLDRNKNLEIICEYEFVNKSGAVISLTEENGNFIKECSCSSIADINNLGPGQKSKIIFTYTLNLAEMDKTEGDEKFQEIRDNKGVVEKEFQVTIGEEVHTLYFTAFLRF
jgi:hypothetical protein